MSTIAEVEKLAFGLPEKDRAQLAMHLLRSLSPVLEVEDEGIAEAMCRDVELEARPEAGMTLQMLDERIRDRRS